MKRMFYSAVAILLLAASITFIYISQVYQARTEEVQRQERIYRTQMQNWSDRLSVAARILSKNKNDTQARLSLYQLQNEMQDTKPPFRYLEAHLHLSRAINYYNSALEANNIAQAVYLLQQFEQEINAAERTYK